MPLDKIICERIQFGKAQIEMYIVIGCFWMLDSAELTVLGFLIPILQLEWGFSEVYGALFLSLSLFSYCIGSIHCGKLSDLYGRIYPLKFACPGVLVFGFLSSYTQNFAQMLLCRMLIGYFIGLTNTISAISQEISPIQKRGQRFIFVNYFFVLGFILPLGIAYLCFTDFTTGDWRSFLKYNSLIAIMPLVSLWWKGYESPRFLFLADKIDKGVEILNYMGKLNKGEIFQEITENEKHSISEWSLHQRLMNSHNHASYKALFTEGRALTTNLLTLIWFGLTFSYYGLILQLPLILSNINKQKEVHGQIASTKDEEFLQMLVQSLIEIPAYIIGYCLIEQPKTGRKNTMSITLLIAAVFSFVIFIFQTAIVFQFAAIIIRLSLALCYAILFQITPEIYPTMYRATGTSFQGFISKLAPLLVPWCMVYLIQQSIFVPFLVFFVITFIGSVASYFLSDTTNKPLDTYFSSHEIENLEDNNNNNNNENENNYNKYDDNNNISDDTQSLISQKQKQEPNNKKNNLDDDL